MSRVSGIQWDFSNFLSLHLHSGVKMTAASMLMKEIETLPEESVAELLDFALFLRTKKTINTFEKFKRKSMFGAFPDINTTVEREEDRV